jgi:hypothetical protein
MKYYYPASPVEGVRLGQGELISAGEEILNRARVLGEALARKVEDAVERTPNSGGPQPGSAAPRDRR